MLSVLRFPDSDYPFGIFKLFLCLSDKKKMYKRIYNDLQNIHIELKIEYLIVKQLFCTWYTYYVLKSSKNDKFLSILKMLYFRWCRRLEGLVYSVTEWKIWQVFERQNERLYMEIHIWTLNYQEWWMMPNYKKNYIIDIFDMYIIDMTYHRVCN